MIVCSAISGNVNLCLYSKKALPIGRFTKVIVEQRKQSDGKIHFVVNIGGVEEFNVVNTRPQIFHDVRYTASDPWHNAAKAQIRNFQLTIKKDCLGKSSEIILSTKYWSL